MADITDSTGLNGAGSPVAPSSSAGSSPLKSGEGDRVIPSDGANGDAPLPSSLPPDDEGFIETTSVLPELLGWLGQPSDSAHTGPLIACIIGGPGTGKTALAVHVARRLRDAYPGGQALLRLENTPPLQARGDFLRAFTSVPVDALNEADQRALYQRLLSGRRILMVLDGAESAKDVQPLLPPHDSSASVIITSRSPLSGLPGAKTFRLPELNEELAREIFRIALESTGRPWDEATLSSLADRFANPLGARIAARLVQDGTMAPTALLDQTAEGGYPSLKLVIDTAYRDLEPSEARLLRLLTLLDRPGLEPGLVAALLDSNQADAKSAMAGLVAHSFATLSEDGGLDTVHQLIRDYAKERLDQEESPEAQRAAKARADRWIARRAGWQPKPRITRDYWTVKDHLGHGRYAAAIASFIRHDETSPPLTIGIKAHWGAGKSSLMRMVQKRLDAPEDEDTWKPRRIRFEEWSRTELGVITGEQPIEEPSSEQASTVTIWNVFRRANLRRPSQIPDLGRLKLAPPIGVAAEEWRPTVWFNPWMYQSSEQIWAGLGHEIIAQVTSRMQTADRERFWLELNIRRVDKLAVRRKIYKMLVERLLPLGLMVGGVVLLALLLLVLAWVMPGVASLFKAVSATLFTGGGVAFLLGGLYRTTRFFGEHASGPFAALVRQPDPIQGARSVLTDEAKGAFEQLVTDPRYEDRLGFLYLVHTDMKRVLDIIATPVRPLVVFVDDLDRCSPAVVAQVIEAINLFLAGEFQNCIFVLAFEPAVVAANVEAAYKELTNNLKDDRLQGDWSSLGWRFLEKIVQLPLSLPRPSSSDPLVVTYVDSLLMADGARQHPTSRPTAGVEVAARQADGEPPNPLATAGSDRTTHTASAPPTVAASDAEARQTTAQEAARKGEIFAELVAKLEEAIQRRAPSIQTLPQMARDAQRELLGTGDHEQLRAETLEASDRVFARLYSDADARDAIVAEVQTRLTSGNAREIKRFINLFRFYTFILQRKRISEASSPDSPGTPTSQEVAKLAALAIRWPYLLNALGAGRDDGSSVLAYLEETARHLTQPDDWLGALEQVGLVNRAASSGQRDDPGWAEDLRTFLGGEPRIGDASKLLL